MDDEQKLIFCLSNLTTDNNQIQSQITEYLSNFIQTNPISFVERVYQIISRNQSQNMIISGLSLLIHPFQNAIKAVRAVKNNDLSKQNLIFSPEFTISFLKELITLLASDNAVIRNISSHLTASALSLLIKQNIQENPLETIIQHAILNDILDHVRVSCLNTLNYFFENTQYDACIAKLVSNSLLQVLENEKSTLILESCINLYSQLTIYFETIYSLDQDEFLRLINAMMSYTQNEELILSCLNFWLKLTQFWYNWLSISPDFINSITELLSSDDDNICTIVIEIITEACLNENEIEEKLINYENLFEPMLELCLTAEGLHDIVLKLVLIMLQNDDFLISNQESLWDFCTSNINVDEIHQEVALRIMAELIDIEEIISDLIEFSFAYLESDNLEVQLASIDLLTKLVRKYGLADKFRIELLNLVNSESIDVICASSELIIEFCYQESINIEEICEILFNYKTFGSLFTLNNIISKFGIIPTIDNELIIQIAENSFLIQDEDLLGITMNIMKEMVSNENESRFFQIAQKSFNEYYITESISLISACSLINPSYVETALNMTYQYLNDYSETEKIVISINSLNFYISKASISLESYANEITTRLLSIVSSLNLNEDIKAMAFDSLNSFFKGIHRQEFLQYFDGFSSAISCNISQIYSFSDESLFASLTDCMSTVIEVIPNEEVFNSAILLIRENIKRNEFGDRFAIETIALLQILLNINPENIKRSIPSIYINSFLQTVIDNAPNEIIQSIAMKLINKDVD